MTNDYWNRTAKIVDDLDFDIEYADGWYYKPSDGEYNGGSHVTNKTGAEAVYKFNGTGIAVWGTIGAWNVTGIPISQYEVDGHLEKYRPTVLAPGRSMTKVLFYESPTLEYGSHTLKITNLGNDTHASMYGFDYLVYSMSASNSTSDTISGPSSGKTWPVAAIAGGIAAVVFVFVLICGLALYLIMKRYRRRYKGERIIDDSSSIGQGREMSHLTVDPFLPSPPSYEEVASTPTSTLASSSPRTTKRLMSFT